MGDDRATGSGRGGMARHGCAVAGAQRPAPHGAVGDKAVADVIMPIKRVS